MHFNLLWMISHPEHVTPEECAAYDLVAVASAGHAERLGRTLPTPVKVLLQATDPNRFHPVPEGMRRAGGVTFVGNSRGEYRPIVRAAVDAGLQPEIYGAGWQELVPPGLIKAASIDNRELAPLYAGARAVLNDHWPSMRAAGFISNRVYDVLASGGALVSDAVDGIDELFGPLVEQVRDMSALPGAVARSAGVSSEQRMASARLVAERHSFDVRARELAGFVAELAGEPGWRARRTSARASHASNDTSRSDGADGPPQEGGNRPDFSIVVPVYNAEPYLGEAIASLLGQRFAGSFEIMIVDDGSTDASAAIAERFRDRHPDIIKVLRQTNRGPSAARNAGFALARGEIVNFLDADDRLERNALRLVRRFFAERGRAVDIVTLPISYFDARRGPHPLNFKFRRRAPVIDLAAEPDAILRHTTASFIRRSALPERPFDEDVRYGEDALTMLRLLLQRPRYGVVRAARLLKRSRRDGSSLVDRLYDAPENLEQLAGWHKAIVAECIRRLGKVPPFVQASLLYDYQWQAKSPQFGFTFRDATRRAAYLAGVREVLAHIDVERIRAARFVSPVVKILLRELKDRPGSLSANQLHRDGFVLPDVEVLFIRAGDDVLVEGRAFRPGPGRLLATVNGDPVELAPNTPLDGSVLFFGNDENRYAGFAARIPRARSLLEFAWDESGRLTRLPILYGPHTGLATDARRRHGIFAGLAFSGESACLRIEPVAAGRQAWRQGRYLVRLALRLRLRQAALRLLAHTVRAGPRTAPAHILLDRVEGGGDNAEFLFRHAIAHRPAGVSRLFFCVTRASPDFARLKTVGNVIAYATLRHRIEMFRGAVVISSHANPATFNPFGRDERFLRDLIDIKRVFAPHGVMNSSDCRWCGREAVNLDLFTTTARDEYEMMLAAPIGYTTRELRLTGMPRYDGLAPGRGDTIVLMPTWRKGLLDRIGRHRTFAEKAAAFGSSDFARTWRGLAESAELKRLAAKDGVKIALVWHPQVHAAFRRWSGGDERLVEANLGRETTDFERLKNTSLLLVTDYSSISFDFAYLGKPVAYYQYDADRMLADRMYHRYAPNFDFAGKGFGPVLHEERDVLGWIADCVMAGGRVAEPYLGRAERYFGFRDAGNCERVWREILSALPHAAR